MNDWYPQCVKTSRFPHLLRGHPGDRFDVIFVDQSDDDALAKAMDQVPSLVLIETPSNPLMRIVDIRAVAGRAKAAGAKVGVDNTFLSPALQRPIPLGADFVIHSTTKYLNGHSDVVDGGVGCAHKSDVETLAAWANVIGVTASPFDCYLTLRGLRTLYPRVERQQITAAKIAAYLKAHPAVATCIIRAFYHIRAMPSPVHSKWGSGPC